jgi:glutamyl-tRNA reductase
VRHHAAAIAREEVERTVRRLGGDAELERRLDALAGAIVAKVLHHPSVRLRQAGTDGESGDDLMDAAARIFDVGEPPSARLV